MTRVVTPQASIMDESHRVAPVRFRTTLDGTSKAI